MAKHRATPAAGFAPLIGLRPRALFLDEPPRPSSGGTLTMGADGLSTTRVMEILERIAERRDEWASNPISLAERVRVLP